jgi:hypothetical protein
VAGEACRAAMGIVVGVGDLVRRTGDGQAQVGYSVAGRSGGRVTLCAVCTVHIETRGVGFLVEPQNHWDGFSWFDLKIGGDSFSQFGLLATGFPVWALNPVATVW